MNGVAHGKFTEYFPGGQKRLSGAFRSGIQEGEWTWWYLDGETALSGNYTKGVPTGTWIWVMLERQDLLMKADPELGWVQNRIREWLNVSQ